MRNLRRYWIAAFAAFAVTWSGVPAHAVECAATPFVSTAGQAILRAARQGTPEAFSGVAGRYGDMHSLALFALGPHRKNLAPAREAEYLALTRGYIGRFLARHSSKVSASGLTVVSCSGPAVAPVVTTRLSGGQKVVFRLYKTRRGYLMRDVNISSIWLGQQLRTTFVQVLNERGGSMSALFAFLRG